MRDSVTAGGPTVSPTEPASAPPLGDWLRVFAPAYRGMLARLVGLNLLSAVAVFIELQLLRSLTIVLSRAAAPTEGHCGIGAWAAAGFPIDPQPCGASLPVLLLGAYAVTIVLQSGVDYAAFGCNNRLTQRARHDVERELLRNLLQQDDAFYLRRSPSEIISRLGGDLQRVGGRRQIVTQAISTGLSVIAVVWVLVAQSWLAAAVGAAISIIGVVAAAPMLRRQQDLDRRSIMTDEQVKAGFEDTLQGVAEIQVSGLLRGVLRRFEQRQDVRDKVALENADLNSSLAVVQKLTFTIGFIAALSLVVFTDLFRGAPVAGQADGGEGSTTAGLIVLLIATLPQLYYKFGDLTQLYGHFRIADVSAWRLRQYEAPAPIPMPPAVEAGAGAPDEGTIVLNRVTYRFSDSRAAQGGPDGISLTIPPRGLIGVVGPAGAGKSTLIRLVLGRQRPLSGSIAYAGRAGPDGAFVYLPQRPILFDAPLGENLFLSEQRGDAAALGSIGERLNALGLLDLIRLKGLDALPAEGAVRDVDLPALRDGFRRAAETALGTNLQPLGPGHAGPRQTVIEGVLGCAVDQEELAQRLTSAHSREAVRGLAATPLGPALAALATALIRQTAPLLAQAGTPDDYNRIAAVKIETGAWQLRSGALDTVMGASEPTPGAPPHPLLIAVALSARIEELEGTVLPVADPASRGPLEAIVAGIARPLQAEALNPLLTWRENLLFAVPDPANIRRLEQVGQVVLDHLRGSPLDRAVIEAGLDYPVGRQGGRLSGGQQQLVALGRALLSPAPFLVLDEPSSAFHPGLRAALVSVLQAEARARAVIVVTHDMDLARGCDRIVFVRGGAVAADGPWSSLLTQSAEFRAWAEHGSEAA